MSKLVFTRHAVGALLLLLLVKPLEATAGYWLTYASAVLVVLLATLLVFALGALFFTERVRGRKGAFATWLIWAFTLSAIAGAWQDVWRPIVALPWIAFVVWWFRWRRRR